MSALLEDELMEEEFAEDEFEPDYESEPAVSDGVSGLIAALIAAQSTTAAHEALLGLCDFAAECFSADASDFASRLRTAGCVPLLVRHVSDPVESRQRQSRFAKQQPSVDEAAYGVQHRSLELLGSLLSSEFDDQGALVSLDLFRRAGGLSRVQAHLLSPYPSNLLAAAALQNITGLDQGDTCRELRVSGCTRVLSRLVSTLTDPADQQTVNFATGALCNLRLSDPNPPPADPTLEEAIRLRRLKDVVEGFQLKRATNKVQTFARRWLQFKRQRVAEAKRARDEAMIEAAEAAAEAEAEATLAAEAEAARAAAAAEAADQRARLDALKAAEAEALREAQQRAAVEAILSRIKVSSAEDRLKRYLFRWVQQRRKRLAAEARKVAEANVEAAEEGESTFLRAWPLSQAPP